MLKDGTLLEDNFRVVYYSFSRVEVAGFKSLKYPWKIVLAVVVECPIKASFEVFLRDNRVMVAIVTM